MLIVSDTTPIIALVKADRLDLLEQLFGTVLLPRAVYINVIKITDEHQKAFLSISCKKGCCGEAD